MFGQGESISQGDAGHEVSAYLVLSGVLAPVGGMYAFCQIEYRESHIRADEEPPEGLYGIVTSFYKGHGQDRRTVYNAGETIVVENSKTFERDSYVFVRPELHRRVHYTQNCCST